MLTMLFRCKPIPDGLDTVMGNFSLPRGGNMEVADRERLTVCFLLEESLKSTRDASRLSNSIAEAGELELVTLFIRFGEQVLLTTVFHRVSPN